MQRLFVALVAQAFMRQSLAIWSVVIAYILYDTALLAFTAWKIWPLGRQPAPAHGEAAPHRASGPTPSC